MPRASYSNKNKGAPKAKPGTGLAAAQKALGLVQNAQGAWVRPNAALATKYMTAMAQNMGYQQYDMESMTPIANRQGERIGVWNQQAGAFELAGRAPGAGSAKGLGKKGPTRGTGTRPKGARKKRAAGTALDEPLSQSPYAESDLSTTSYLRTQGKAYAAGRAGNAGSLAGSTAAPAAKKKPAKRKGMLKKKGRGGGVMKPTIKISKSGKVTPNKGGRRKK